MGTIKCKYGVGVKAAEAKITPSLKVVTYFGEDSLSERMSQMT
jgi:hypothetical protein